MLKYSGDPRPRYDRESHYTNANTIPTVRMVNETFRAATAAVIWQIMRSDPYSATPYRGAELGIDENPISDCKRRQYIGRVKQIVAKDRAQARRIRS